MAVGYDGKEIGGYMGVFIGLQDKLKAGDASVTKETFVQLLADVDVFRDAHATDTFGQKSPIEGKSASLGFPDITASEAQAIFAKIKTSGLAD